MAMSWVLLHIGHKRVAGCRPRKRAPSITHLPRQVGGPLTNPKFQMQKITNIKFQISRFSIVQDEAGFSLSIGPTRSDDSGVYFCLVNGAEQPTRGLRLAIQVDAVSACIQYTLGLGDKKKNVRTSFGQYFFFNSPNVRLRLHLIKDNTLHIRSYLT